MLTMYLIGCALALAWFGFLSEISDCLYLRDIALLCLFWPVPVVGAVWGLWARTHAALRWAFFNLLWSLVWGAISIASLMTLEISPMQALNWALVGGIHIAFLAYYFGQICELRNDHQDPA